MAEVRVGKSNYVRFILKSDISQSKIMDVDPVGWDDDELEVIRHKQYHGVFTQFGNALIFYGDDKDYILNNFKVKGLNGNLWLRKEKLAEIDGEIKWREEYIGLADYNTLKIKDNGLSIKFNSNDLEELIKSHETDEFELDRKDSIDDKPITELNTYKTKIKGRTLTASGESKSLEFDFNRGWHIRNSRIGTLQTILVSQGPARHSSVDVSDWPGNTSGELPSNMFFVDTVASGEIINIDVKIKCRYESFCPLFGNNIDVELRKFKWNGINAYSLEESTVIFTSTDNGVHYFEYEFSNEELAFDEGYALVFKKQSNNNFCWIKPYGEGLNIKINTKEYHEPSVNLDFIFIHEAYEKLMEILTGERNRFYSRLFGNSKRNDVYTVDGEFSNIGLIHGLGIRAWEKGSNLYKSIKLKLKDLNDSMKTVFNTGMGIETINFKQRLRVEKLDYFYQDRVVIKLGEVYDVEEEIDKDLFFSGIELGYQYGGEYENELGLDEPNTRTSWVTPIRKSKNKYNFSSKIRADEYGMEIIRRKPQEFYSTEDTQQDDHVWFLDLKEELGSNGISLGSYEQLDWQDRLNEEPTGVLSPETFRSMLFTPLRILFRHGWIIRAGLEQYENLLKNIKYISSKANTTLKMYFTGESQSFSENEDLKAGNLLISKILPNKIKFKTTIDDTLIDQIYGFTEIEIDGQIEKVPNTYFKCEWLQYGVVKRGYLMSFKPKGEASFEMQESNEQLIKI